MQHKGKQQPPAAAPTWLTGYAIAVAIHLDPVAGLSLAQPSPR